jgi:hypothetical protein
MYYMLALYYDVNVRSWKGLVYTVKQARKCMQRAIILLSPPTSVSLPLKLQE